MPNYQLADFNAAVDPNSEWAKQAAAQVLQQQQAQPAVQQAAQQQTPMTMPQPATAVASPQPAPQIAPMPNNNGLAATAANTLTPLDDAGRTIASQIAKFKMNYDAAQAAGDTAGMAQAHNGAEGLRKAAEKYGIDISRLGENDSTDAYKALLQVDYAKGVSDIANMVTPQEYLQQTYQQNLANGMSKRQAYNSALDATEAYEGRYKRELGNAFARYGVNDQGEMNRFGAQIANLMYGNNPQSVALYDQYYANPMQQWKFNKNMEVQDKLYGQKVDFGQHQFDWNRALNNDKFNFQLRLQANQFNFQKTMAEMQQEFAKASRDEQIALARDNPELFMLLHGGGTDGQSLKNSKGSQPTDKQITDMKNARDIFDAAFNGNLHGDNIEAAISDLDKVKQNTADEDARNTLEAMKYALNAKREGVALNDHGYVGAPDNFIDYYEAVANGGYPELVASLKWIYEAAKAKKANPDKPIPYDPSYYTGMRG